MRTASWISIVSALSGCALEPRIFECLTATECAPGTRCVQNICVGSGDTGAAIDPDATSTFADASSLGDASGPTDAGAPRDAAVLDASPARDAAPARLDAAAPDAAPQAPRHVTWIGDTITAGNYAAFVADVSGVAPSAPVQVSPLAPSGEASMHRQAFSADHTKLAFLGDLITDEVVELFVVDLGGAAPGPARRVNMPLVSPANVVSYTWSPDSRSLYYSATNGARTEGYVVDTSGPMPAVPRKVSGNMVTGGNLLGAGFSPDGSRVVYVADQEVDEAPYLYVSTLAGPAFRLNATRTPAVNVAYPGFTHFVRGSSGIVYVADQRVAGVRELWMSDLTTSPPLPSVRLSSDLVATGQVRATQASPDGRWVVYLADQNTAGDTELFVVDLRGANATPAVRLGATLVSGGDVLRAAWSPDSTRLVYLADQDIFNTVELYMVGVGGAGPIAPTKVNAPFVPTEDVDEATDGVAWSPDGRWIAYRADVTADESSDLFVAPVTAAGPGAAVRVSGVASEPDAGSFAFSPDSRRIAFTQYLATSDRTQLLVVDLASGTPSAPVLAAAPAAAGSAIGGFAWFRSDKLAFTGKMTAGATDFSAYLVDLGQTPLTPVRLHPAPPAGGGVSYLFSQR